MESKTWEQTEEILQNLFEEKLQLENISVERAQGVGNKEKNNNEQYLSSEQVLRTS